MTWQQPDNVANASSTHVKARTIFHANQSFGKSAAPTHQTGQRGIRSKSKSFVYGCPTRLRTPTKSGEKKRKFKLENFSSPDKDCRDKERTERWHWR